jgi:hypothetical protein
MPLSPIDIPFFDHDGGTRKNRGRDLVADALTTWVPGSRKRAFARELAKPLEQQNAQRLADLALGRSSGIALPDTESGRLAALMVSSSSNRMRRNLRLRRGAGMRTWGNLGGGNSAPAPGAPAGPPVVKRRPVPKYLR